jgi:hypothetical protein
MNLKDEQIEKLNENMHNQAVYIQTLIQENSRRNTKLLSEETGKKIHGGDFGSPAAIIP